VAGQPTKYREEYCEQLVEHMKQGYSFESFSATIGTHRDTLYEWVKVQPAFSDAKKRAREGGQFMWEKMGIAGANGKLPNFNTGAWIFNMKNRFRWTDRVELSADEAIPIKLAYDPNK